MSIRAPDLFNLYREKANGILRDRNMFLAIFLTTLIALFVPLAYSGNFIEEFKKKVVVSYILLLLLTAIPMTIFMFCEAKYREYRLGYMKVAINSICESELNNDPPETYEKLCKFIYKKTLFSPNHIMPILMEIYPPKPSPSDKNSADKSST